MNKEDIEKAIIELKQYKLREEQKLRDGKIREEERKRHETWVRRKCIGIGMTLAAAIHQVAGWALDHSEQLYAAWKAFFAKGTGQ